MMQDGFFPEIQRQSTPRGGTVTLILSGWCFHQDPAFAQFGIGLYRTKDRVGEVSLLRDEVEALSQRFPARLYATEAEMREAIS